jgi:hypothetical protein
MPGRTARAGVEQAASAWPVHDLAECSDLAAGKPVPQLATAALALTPTRSR